MQELNKIEQKCGHKFTNRNLLETALTHSSYANLKGIESNERLEFLGDAVLNFTVAVEIFKKNPQKNEQFLTELKSAYVNRNLLHQAGTELSLRKALKHVGLKNPRTDQIVEALIGAIYLDGGFQAARRFIKKFILSNPAGPLKDYKGLLKTVAMEKFKKPVIYKVEKIEGPQHNRVFTILAKIEETEIKSRAIGRTKKDAELKASQLLLKKIKDSHPS
ncbi:MAG: ribonuclease III [Candidatus Omnitrophica bacterium]|nr:ribonuclease III [Candidatus Omnitrophota bacterium]